MDASKEQILEEKIDYLKTMCKLKGMRVTPQRIAIFKEVAKSCEHPDAETVYEAVKHKMPNVSVDTVYRTLSSLEEMDMIFRVDNQLPKARFDADKTPHHHFLCTQCNEGYDIFLEPGAFFLAFIGARISSRRCPPAQGACIYASPARRDKRAPARKVTVQ